MLKKLFHLTDKGEKDLQQSIIATVLTDIAMMVPFIVMVQVIFTILNPFMSGVPLDINRIWMLLGAGIVAAVIHYLVYGYEYAKTFVTAYREAEATRVEVAERMRQLPLSFFNRKDLSELTSNIMADCTVIEHSMSHVVPSVIGHSISITLICAMIAVFDWRMALAIYCTLPIAGAIILLSRRLQDRWSEKLILAKLEASKNVQEYLEGIKVIKAFGMEGEKFSAMDSALRQLRSVSMLFETVVGSIVMLALVILQVGIGIVVFVGVQLLLDGNLDVVAFIAFMIASIRLYSPLNVVMMLLPEMFHLIVATRRMQDLRVTPVMQGDTSFVPTTRDIQLDHVTFGYNQQAVIKDLSLEIPQGQVVALVGPSGSGKSTVTRLISRFWDVDTGQILIGGRNIRNVAPETLMDSMSFVFQDVVLFNDTIYNNIRIGKRTASHDEVLRAAELARCDDFIRAMPEGYETVIGENGSTLSGGERQRISIARAILKDAPIVLLDEATASLDPENETQIQAALSALVQGRTVIVIAHRLRTVRDVQRIFVLNQGQLVEQGCHDELIAQGGLYARLFRIQQESAGWSYRANLAG